MLTHVIGATVWQRKHVHGLVDFFADQYLDPDTKDNIHLWVSFQKGKVDKTRLADCWLIRNRTATKACYIRIRISSPVGSSKFQCISRLSHELVHMQQFATGDLRFNIKGVHYKDSYIKDDVYENMTYYEYPWEIEALGREFGITLAYARHAKIWDEVLPYKLNRLL